MNEYAICSSNLLSSSINEYLTDLRYFKKSNDNNNATKIYERLYIHDLYTDKWEEIYCTYSNFRLNYKTSGIGKSNQKVNLSVTIPITYIETINDQYTRYNSNNKEKKEIINESSQLNKSNSSLSSSSIKKNYHQLHNHYLHLIKHHLMNLYINHQLKIC